MLRHIEKLLVEELSGASLPIRDEHGIAPTGWHTARLQIITEALPTFVRNSVEQVIDRGQRTVLGNYVGYSTRP